MAELVRAWLRMIAIVPRRRLILLLALSLAVAASEGVGVLMLLPIIEAIGRKGATDTGLGGDAIAWIERFAPLPSLGVLLLAFVALIALRALVQLWRETLSARIQHACIDSWRQRSFYALIGAEWTWLVRSRRSDHAHLLLGNVDRIGVAMQSGLGLIGIAVTAMLYVALATALAPAMTMVALLCSALLGAMLWRQRRAALDLGWKQNRASAKLFENVGRSMAGIKLTKILGNEARHEAEFQREVQVLRNHRIAFQHGQNVARAMLQIAAGVMLAGILYVAVTGFAVERATLVALVILFARLLPLGTSLQQQWVGVAHAIPAFTQAEKMIAECDAVREPMVPDDDSAWPVADSIRLDHIGFSYGERDTAALHGIDLTLTARTTTAIMGPSGAGKSTLADLLIGLIAPSEGRMLIDGVEVSGAERMRWRRNVAYVPQDVFLFHASIRDNLRWGRADADDDALREALTRASADFVFALPQGLDTVVGDSGERLSGGERQRIALARALLRRPSLLILDEATSALDRENERRIREAVEALHGDVTIVVIGHRLPTLEHADQVVLLEDGQVRACGPWSELRPLATTL